MVYIVVKGHWLKHIPLVLLIVLLHHLLKLWLIRKSKHRLRILIATHDVAGWFRIERRRKRYILQLHPAMLPTASASIFLCCVTSWSTPCSLILLLLSVSHIPLALLGLVFDEEFATGYLVDVTVHIVLLSTHGKRRTPFVLKCILVWGAVLDLLFFLVHWKL